MTRRFLLDENMSHAVRDGLRRRDERIEVMAIGDANAPPFGTPDPAILEWLEAGGYSLATYNRASMPVHLADHLVQGHHVRGLFVLDDRMSIGAAIDELFLIWFAARPDEFADTITYLPLRTE